MGRCCNGECQGDLPSLRAPNMGARALQRPMPALRQDGSGPVCPVDIAESWCSSMKVTSEVPSDVTTDLTGKGDAAIIRSQVARGDYCD